MFNLFIYLLSFADSWAAGVEALRLPVLHARVRPRDLHLWGLGGFPLPLIVLYYIIVYHITFYYMILYYSTLHYITLHYITLHYITLYITA